MHVTDDAFLGGRLQILQPRQGYRAGLDAVMLAAAVKARGRGLRVLDAGAGVGTAGLCLAWRCPMAHVVLVEREAALVALARENIARNGLSERAAVAELDIARGAAPAILGLAGLADASFDVAIANPPYHAEGAGTAAHSALKASAHAMQEAELDDWARFLARMVRPGGEVFIIHKTAALPDVLQALDGRFGALSVLPLYSHAGEGAGRVIVSGVKGSRAPFRIEAGIVLHDAENRSTPGAEAVLRLGQSLAVAYGRAEKADAAP